MFNIFINFNKNWPRCKVEVRPEMDMMNDFSSISYEIEHILKEVRVGFHSNIHGDPVDLIQ